MQSQDSSLIRSFLLSFLALAAAITAGCGGGASSPGSAPFLPPPPAKQGKHFTHIVVLIQENRTLDNLFATFPGADGTTVGKTHNGTRRLAEANLESPISPNNGYEFWIRDYNHGQMNHFDLVPIGRTPGTYVYQYVDPAQIRPYWDLAKQYVLCRSYVSDARQRKLYRASGSDSRRHRHQRHAKSDRFSDRSRRGAAMRPPALVTTLITTSDRYMPNAGPFPCLNYEHAARHARRERAIVALLRARRRAKLRRQLMERVRRNRGRSSTDPEWSTNQISPETKVLTDISRDTLPAVSWVIPDFRTPTIPAATTAGRRGWRKSSTRSDESPAWKTRPPSSSLGRLGRLVRSRRAAGDGVSRRTRFSRSDDRRSSPYAKAGYVSHNQYELGSIVRFVEDNWNLRKLRNVAMRPPPTLPTTSSISNSRRASSVPIGAKYSRSYFLRRTPSNRAVDNE